MKIAQAIDLLWALGTDAYFSLWSSEELGKILDLRVGPAGNYRLFVFALALNAAGDGPELPHEEHRQALETLRREASSVRERLVETAEANRRGYDLGEAESGWLCEVCLSREIELPITFGGAPS